MEIMKLFFISAAAGRCSTSVMVLAVSRQALDTAAQTMSSP